MEEKILEIIQKNAAGSTEYITDGLYHKLAVREIANHFKEFIEWYLGECDIVGYSTRIKDLNNDEIYTYWLNLKK